MVLTRNFPRRSGGSDEVDAVGLLKIWEGGGDLLLKERKDALLQ